MINSLLFIPVSASHMIRQEPISAETILLPSEENATAVRERLCSVRGTRTSILASTSQSRTHMSAAPDTILLPSGENAIQFTSPLWPHKTDTGWMLAEGVDVEAALMES